MALLLKVGRLLCGAPDQRDIMIVIDWGACHGYETLKGGGVGEQVK